MPHIDPDVSPPKTFLRGFPLPPWLVAATLTIAITAGGWIFELGRSSARFEAVELRVSTIENLTVGKQVMVEKERVQAEHNADVERRLARIEVKVDDLLTREFHDHTSRP